jgi:alpha-L-fucosidase
MNPTKLILASGFVLLSASVLLPAHAEHPVLAIQDTETKAQRDTRMGWWREAKFGMFIHWGLYAAYGEEGKKGGGEWTMHGRKIPVSEYKATASKFNPTRFSAETWVSIAKAAGMKYIVITAKHHDGFAMYHTAVDSYNIYDSTPFKRDPIAELAEACKKAGIKFGVYYSQNIDWSHPGGATHGPTWDPVQVGDYDTYLKTIAAPQVTELVKNYHPDVFWWDYAGELTPEQAKILLAPFSDHPEVIRNSRMGKGYRGHSDNYEQYIPTSGRPGRDWEVCMTLNKHWGLMASDTDYKPAPVLVRNLVETVSKGGNYLLNTGPDSKGLIPQPEADRLKQVGDWLQRNGESVYGTKASPLTHLPSNERITIKGEKLYLHVFDWSRGSAILPGLVTEVESATTLVNQEKLKITRDAEGTTLLAAPSTPDSLNTVVVLKLRGSLEIKPVSTPIFPDATGSLKATAGDADLSDSLTVMERDSSVIGLWNNPAKDKATWKLMIPKTGDYVVKLTYFAPYGGTTLNIAVSEAQKLKFTVVETGGKTIKTFDVTGVLYLEAGMQRLTVVPTSLAEPVNNDPLRLALQDIVLSRVPVK